MPSRVIRRALWHAYVRTQMRAAPAEECRSLTPRNARPGYQACTLARVRPDTDASGTRGGVPLADTQSRVTRRALSSVGPGGPERDALSEGWVTAWVPGSCAGLEFCSQLY